MNRIGLILTLFPAMMLLPWTSSAQERSAIAEQPAVALSPTDARIADDRRQIRETPDRFQSYNDLALALIAKSRETTDLSFKVEAGKVLNTALRLAPDNLQVLKTRVALLLAQREFVQARAEAKALNARMPDDVSLYGYLATADIELGNYGEAETEAQWMLNLLPNNVPGFLLGARLREIYGDPEGALEFLNQAYSETLPSEIQELAAIGDQIARVEMNRGHINAAEQALQEILKIYPGYPAAVQDLDKLNAAKRRREEEKRSSKDQSSTPAVLERPIVTNLNPVATDSDSVFSSQPSQPKTSSTFEPVPPQLLLPKPTETDRIIRSLQLRISREPGEHALYAQLGAAFFQKARETGDVTDFENAERALKKSLDLTSNDLAAAAPTVALAEVYMGEHRFADALAYAQKSLALGSGDSSPLAIAGDAYADTGEYDTAMDVYLKLSVSGSQATYTQDSRIAFLRFISGDTEAAVRLMRRAIANGVLAQLPAENLAWLYYELGEYCFQNGNAVEADQAYRTALTVHPGDYRALAGLARVRATQGRYADAIELYQKALAVVPMPLFASELGDIYAKVGRSEDARKQFELVEYIGSLGTINRVLHNRDLALFYADHEMNLTRALELARKEFEVRHDIYTWDVLAWVLYKNGKPVEAADAIKKALRFHTRDALLLFHAGMIYGALGQNAESRNYLTQAISVNAHFHVVYADQVSHRLAELDALSAQSKNERADHAR